MAGFAIVWAGCLTYAIPGQSLAGKGLAPLAMTATGFLLTWLVFRDRIFDIVPVARETLITNMCDGVIVIDDQGIIAEMNPAAQALLGAREEDAGKPADEVLRQWPDLCRCCREGTIGTPSEILLDGPAVPRWLDIRISLLPAAGEGCAGRLIVMRDITELKCSHESLRAEMLERLRAEEQIRLSLREKEVLLKEIHHRVKNNMQIISSLLNLQSEKISNENAEVFRESQNRIKTMALIHEKLYQSSDLSYIDFGEYADGLASYLIRSYAISREVSIDLAVQNIPLGIDLAIPCGLIINELVSNSLKYAFKDGHDGTVHIGLARDDNTYTLRVSDDGPGLPNGFDYRDSPSLGLQLVNTLVGQLEGTIELDSTAGAAYTIRFRAR
jgi:two-component sensor histidine kinase